MSCEFSTQINNLVELSVMLMGLAPVYLTARLYS